MWVIIQPLSRLWNTDHFQQGGSTLIGLFLIFILLANYAGLVPGLQPPTASINVTLSLALISFVYYHSLGIRKHGLFKYLRHFAGPMLGLFLLGMLTKVREGAALFGVGTGVLLVFVLAWYQKELPFHRLWLCPISTVATLVAGAIRGRS